MLFRLRRMDSSEEIFILNFISEDVLVELNLCEESSGS